MGNSIYEVTDYVASGFLVKRPLVQQGPRLSPPCLRGMTQFKLGCQFFCLARDEQKAL
jgi:hypothetical protein